MRKITLSLSKILHPFLLFLFLTKSYSAFAEPKFTTKYQYFKIGGTNIESLWYDINRNGPKSSLGVGHAGYTSFDFDNSVGVAPRNGKCQIISIDFHLISIVQLPKWTDERNSDQEMRLYWKAFSADVKRHEDQHVEIAKQSILKLEQQLLKLRPQNKCDVLKRKVRNTMNKSARTRNRDQNTFERKEIRGQRARLTRLIEELRNK